MNEELSQEEKESIQANAECFEIVHTDAWNKIVERFSKATELLTRNDHISGNRTDYEQIGKEQMTRVGAVSVINTVLEEIQTGAEMHEQYLESLKDDPNRIVHRHSEST